jgi:hypothetical protein
MALKTFVTGEVLTAADVNLYLSNNIFARKTATETVTSSTTLQDDDNLTVSVAANSVYEVTCLLRYTAVQAADLKFQFVGPASATLHAGVHRLGTGAADEATDALEYLDISDVTTSGGLGNTFDTAVKIQGLLVVAGTAGTFKLQWAQDTSNATGTELRTGSYLCLRRVS